MKIETTYADLRDGDLLIDKSGGHWHVSVVEQTHEGELSEPGAFRYVSDFWLGDPRTKVRMHHMTKPAGDPCTVERIATHADDVEKLEAGSILPDPSRSQRDTEGGSATASFGSTSEHSATLAGIGSRGLPGVASPEENARRADVIAETFAAPLTTYAQTGIDLRRASSHEQAVAAVEVGMPGATVDVDVTAAEVDAARQATDDEPVVLPLFESMTDLEQRSHLFVLHGLFAEDVEDRKTRAEVHVKAHRDKAQGKLYSRSTPHVHSEAVTA